MKTTQWFATQRSLQHCMGKEQRHITQNMLNEALALPEKNCVWKRLDA